MRLPSYLALFACLGGGYLLVGGEPAAAPSTPRPAVRSAKIALPVVIQSDRTDKHLDTPAPEIQSDQSDEPDEEIRGLASYDTDELAMVFVHDGVSYLRLSEEPADAHGTPRLTEIDGVAAVVAPVGVAALPSHLQKWAGRTVLVNGDCRARVAGFAEVSRVTGEAGDPFAYDEDGNPPEPTPWTIELVREANLVLAARLDGACTGSWARAESEAPAAIAEITAEPALEAAALADLTAKTDHDETQVGWAEMGGEGDWRDYVDVSAVTWQHPLTGEKWVFAQAALDGSCGEPSVSLMAAYRVRADGSVRRAADLSFAHSTIDQIVDLDGDGQPELVLGGGDSAELVDLANAHHESIYVPNHSHGCGC